MPQYSDNLLLTMRAEIVDWVSSASLDAQTPIIGGRRNRSARHQRKDLVHDHSLGVEQLSDIVHSIGARTAREPSSSDSVASAGGTSSRVGG